MERESRCVPQLRPAISLFLVLAGMNESAEADSLPWVSP